MEDHEITQYLQSVKTSLQQAVLELDEHLLDLDHDRLVELAQSVTNEGLTLTALAGDNTTWLRS